MSVPSGSIPLGTENVNVVPQGLFRGVQDIQNVVITNTPAGSVTVGDIATVKEGDKTQYSLQRLNGQDAVGLSITANSDANTVAVSDAVQAQLARLEDLLPETTRARPSSKDQSVFTRASLDSIQRDLALAVIMVALVILVFLHDWKHTAIVLCAIPTSLISTFLVMYLLHFTLNTMSMMALALMIGILVDDSIVVLENIHRHLQLGENPIAAALNGRSEIGLAALAITACDVVVYTPVAFMSGGRAALPAVRLDGHRRDDLFDADIVHADADAGVALAAVTPKSAGRFRRLRAFGERWDRGFARMSEFFAQVLPLTLRFRWLVLALAARTRRGRRGTDSAARARDGVRACRGRQRIRAQPPVTAGHIAGHDRPGRAANGRLRPADAGGRVLLHDRVDARRQRRRIPAVARAASRFKQSPSTRVSASAPSFNCWMHSAHRRATLPARCSAAA